MGKGYCESKAHKNQFLFDFYKSEKCWQALFLECLAIAEMVTKSILQKQRRGFDKDKIYDVCVDATVRLLERKRRGGKAYVIKVFRSCLWNEVQFALADKKQAKINKEIDITDVEDIITVAPDDTGEELRWCFLDLMSLPNGRKIIYTIFMASSFRKAILSLDTFMPRRAIYDNVGKIKSIYEWTRVTPIKDTDDADT